LAKKDENARSDSMIVKPILKADIEESIVTPNEADMPLADKVIPLKEDGIGEMTDDDSTKANDDNIALLEIEINNLEPYRVHLFDTYVGDRLQELAEGIIRSGLLNPIIIRPKDNGKYEILSGHNRVNAFKLLKLDKIKAFIREGLTDKEAEQIVLDANLDQQSFSDWNYSQQIRVIRKSSRYIQENSQQGKRTDIQAEGTSVSSGHKSADKPKQQKTRDKAAKRLGISTSTFERYRSIANLNEDRGDTLGRMIDNKSISFMGAYRLSQLKPEITDVVINYINSNPDPGVKSKNIQQLYIQSKASEANLTDTSIIEILTTDYTNTESAKS